MLIWRVRAAADIDAADAVHGFERAADLLVGDFGELADRAVAADGQGDDGIAVGIRLWRRSAAARSAAACACACDTFSRTSSDASPMSRSSTKVTMMLALPSRHHRAHLVDAADRGDRFFERQDDLRRDFFRTGARQSHAHVHGRRIGAREQIDAEVHEAEHSQNDQEEDQHEGEDRPLDADFR